jgi:8-oxo-dGTP pyrophosphatase MutT (NUDIX family)
MVRAADTGRVLLLQRSIREDDPAAGLWEPAGGHVEPGETLLQGARREWQEETGKHLPDGQVTGSWTSGDGIYRGFIYDIPAEDSLDIFTGRDQVANPDGDPHGDVIEAIAWFSPEQFAGNPSLRPEMARDLPVVVDALHGAMKSAKGQTSAEILREYWRGEAHPGPTRFALERKIRWGEPSDWYRCHSLLTPYLGSEGARGYCNLRHKEVLGYYPAQHARMEREGKT